MGNQAISGVGTLFRRWNSSTGSWENISEITNISGPGMSRETLDTTSLDTAGGYRTFAASFRDPGTVTLSMNFYADGYDTMKTDFESDTKQNYEIVLPDDAAYSLEFEGLVTECPLEIPEGLVTADITIKVSGQVNAESGSGPSANA